MWRMHQAYLFCACTRGAWLECISFLSFPPSPTLSGGTSGPCWSALSAPRAFTAAAKKMSHTVTPAIADKSEGLPSVFFSVFLSFFHFFILLFFSIIFSFFIFFVFFFRFFIFSVFPCFLLFFSSPFFFSLFLTFFHVFSFFSFFFFVFQFFHFSIFQFFNFSVFFFFSFFSFFPLTGAP